MYPTRLEIQLGLYNISYKRIVNPSLTNRTRIRGPVNAQLCVIDALEADFDALQILE